ncbi:MAG: hypothetical protein U0P45_05460 [Acidimicrobiales bacterium]
MTDRDHLPDELDDRIRGALATVVGEAPEPPGFERLDDGLQRSSVTARRLLAAAAVVVAVAAIGFGLAARTNDGHRPSSVHAGRTTTTAATDEERSTPDRPFWGTRWELVGGRVDGEPVRIQDPQRPPTATFTRHWECPALPRGQHCSQPDGPTYGFSDGCNDGGGSLLVRGRTIRPLGMGSTLVGCTYPSYAPVQFVPHDSSYQGPASFGTLQRRVVGDRLTLTGTDGFRLVYRAFDEPWGPPKGTVVREGLTTVGAYRLSWTGGRRPQLRAEVADRSRGGCNRSQCRWKDLHPSSLDVVAATDSRPDGSAPKRRITISRRGVGWETIVYGVVPAGTQRVEYRSASHTTELELVDLPGDRWAGYVGTVPVDDEPFEVRAIDPNDRPLSVGS